MKFAKELEQELVPEWRVKYLNYKGGKKLIKQITRAINRANGTPGSHLPPSGNYSLSTGRSPLQEPSARNIAHSDPQSIPAQTERASLTANSPRYQYGSFVLTPPNGSSLRLGPTATDNDSFALPDPALRPTPAPSTRPYIAPRNTSTPSPLSQSAYPAATSAPPPRRGTLSRLFSNANHPTLSQSDGINLPSWDQAKKRNDDFIIFLHSELAKVEGFYKLKENQAGERLDLLREQLHEMRNRRSDEMLEQKKRQLDATKRRDIKGGKNTSSDEDSEGKAQKAAAGFIDPVRTAMFRPGSNSRALQEMPFTPALTGQQDEEQRRDYVRRPVENDVPYRTAKRKLKLALQEFYRGLELLKAYALLNRTAFRKLNKKYDKAVYARTPYKFMNDHVNKSWFVNSDALDQHVRTVEDLYARYFEKGNHKIAVGKLRVKKGTTDESGSAFRCGILLGTGVVFAIQALISATSILLHSEDKKLRADTSYLLQLYGGYFLMLYLFLLFCLNCRQWNKNKVNYPFIFEFDPRNHLDWRQLSEFPCFFMLLFGIIFWFNFSNYGSEEFFLWYPVVLVALSVFIFLLPAPILAHKARSWFVYSHWRLLLAGIYPVEFRDFFLGDIYCSLTYALCNVSLFFCLYGDGWENPAQCNSSHSRLMGFLSALPPIWRALQCIRRYYDTKNVFPHLVNCGKYFMTIMSAITLSLYRIDRTQTHLGLFIAFSSINAVYASFWDLFMDFSLMQPHAKTFMLRNILAFKSKGVYWVIVVIDPILRFSWIFYAIFSHDVQHSALVSFMVALAEASRRGAWALIRVENEHCANVSQYKASRDVPLPYRMEPLMSGIEEGEETSIASSMASRQTSAIEPESTDNQQLGIIRRRHRGSTVASVRGLGRILAEAHKQDFEKRRKVVDADADGDAADDEEDDDDEENDVELDEGTGHSSAERPSPSQRLNMTGANGHHPI